MEDSALAKAIEAADGQKVLDLLNAVSDLDATDAPGRLTDSNGRTLFHAAAQHMPENVEVLKTLVAMGVDPAARDHEGESGIDALMASSAESGTERVAAAVLDPVLEQGDLKGLEGLAMAGWTLDQCSPPPDQVEEKMAGLTEEVKVKLAQLVEAQSKQAAVAQQLHEGSEPVTAERLEELGSLVTGLTRDGVSLMHLAVMFQRPEAVDTILAAAPDSVAVLDYMKRSPLHFAASCPPGTEIYQTLVNAGASDALIDVTGKTPMSYASQPANLALEEVKAKIEQRLKSKVASASVAAEEGAPEASEEKPQEQPGDKTGDNSDQADDKPGDSPEQTEKESEAQAPAEEAKVPAGPKKIKSVDMYVCPRGSSRRDPPVPPPSTVDGKYIAQHLGEALTSALAEIAEVRPWDPIEYLARWLYKYRRDDAFSRKQEELLKTIRDEEARMRKEEELKFKRMEELRRYQEEEAEKRRIEEEERKKKEQEELLRSAKESALAQKPALPTVSEEAEETNDEDDDGEEDDDTSVKDRDRAGQTELHKLAAQQGMDFTALIQLGYSIADRNINGKTARDIAQEAGQKETVLAIDNYLKKVLDDGREDVLEQLVLDGFDGLDSVDKDSVPEVTKAALDRLTGLKDVIVSTMKSATSKEELSETEAQEAVDAQPLLVKAKDEAGRSLLHLAVVARAVKLVTHLASNFPESLKSRDNCNRTPLHYACGTSSDLAELLISKGASTKARDAMKRRPAFYKNNSADIKAIQASLGLSYEAPLSIPQVTVGDTEQTSADSAADDTAEETQLATFVGADIPPRQTTDGQQEQQAV